MLITQKISNSKIFPDVERLINIVGINMNADASTLSIYYRISYKKDDQDISHLFNSKIPEWYVDNSQQMMLRDENFKPMPNPDFIEERDELDSIINEKERYLTMPAFDYMKKMVLEEKNPIKILINAYINEEDKDGRFNF